MKTVVQGIDMALGVISGITGFVITFLEPALGWGIILFAGFCYLNYQALEEK